MCQGCLSSKDVEDEQHSYLVAQLTVIGVKVCQPFSAGLFCPRTFSLTLNQMHVVIFSEIVFHVENLLYPPYHRVLFYVLYSVCWPSVGPQDI